ncbi:MAG TPA: hypothetical protein VMU80_09105 [Bryobacteraceae bacterium]|nr:hypothetical protein [Bryobacteraceae bacterium]
MEDEHRQWLVLAEAPKSEGAALESLRFLNLDTVRMAERLEPLRVRLHFSETFSVDVHGQTASELLVMLMQRGVLSDGTPFPRGPVKTGL